LFEFYKVLLAFYNINLAYFGYNVNRMLEFYMEGANMKIYDTLLIGSGYYAAGYADAQKNCLIVEEGQVADTQFYLPMRGFAAEGMKPMTKAGGRLFDLALEMGLFRDGGLCANALESLLARHMLAVGTPILLKCRAVRTCREGELTRVTLLTNAGLSDVYAKKILDTRPRPRHKAITVLLHSAEPIGAAASALLAAFPGAELAPAFYEGRTALTVPADGYDENTVTCMIHDRFPKISGVRILYIAPSLVALGCEGQQTDAAYSDPIAAYEAGLCAAEVRA
jgi:hypothetical protein